MSRAVVSVLATILLSSGASADEPNLTPEECAGLHLGVRQIAHKIDDVEHEIGPLNWDSIANNVSASLRDATVSAKDAEANFFTALREYKIAITRLFNDPQFCR